MVIDYSQLASQYLDARMNRAMQPFTDTEGYLNNRLQQQYGVTLDEQGNVKPRSTTITNNDDGTQTITTKHELNPEQPQPAVMPAAAPAPSAFTGFNEFAPNISQPQPMVQPQVSAASAPQMPQPQMPQMPQPQMAAQPEVPAVPVAPSAPQAAQLPQPSPGVQLAGPMVPGALPQPAPQPVAVAPQAQPSATAVAAPATPAAQPAAPTAPAWLGALESSQGDITKLHAFAGNETYPKDVRDIASQLTAKIAKGQLDESQAQKTIQRWLSGDTKAQTEIMRDLKREEGSYVKAYLLNRLGFGDLAKQEMEKISPTTKFGQSILDGKSYAVETDNRGAVIRAWDNEGTRQDNKVLAALNAGGAKFGAQAYGFTGEPGIVREADGTMAEVRQRTNSITGQIENIYVTGPKAGERYTGTQIPQAKSVTTAAAKVDYDLAASLYKKHSGNVIDMLKDYEQIKGPQTPEQRQEFFQRYGYGAAVPQPQLTAPLNAAPAPTAQATPQLTVPRVPAGAPQAPQTTAPTTSTVPAVAQRLTQQTPIAAAPGVNVPQGGVTTPIGALQTQQALGKKAGEEAIVTTETVKREELKPPAAAKGKIEAKDINNQNFADESYGLIKPVADLVKQSTGSGIGASVDKLAATFGKGTAGAQAIAQLEVLTYPLLANVPRFEGPQSDYDVKTYQKAAGDFANPEKPIATRLAALQGMITLLKKYDKENKNDWTFGGTAAAAGGVQAGTTKTIGGVTYEFDGKGWKKK